MNEDLESLPIEVLLERTQTNVTPDNTEAIRAADIAIRKAVSTGDDLHLGVAARQRGIRAELAGLSLDTVRSWFDLSREALSSDDSKIKRELIATDLLEGRALTHRIETAGALGSLALGARTYFDAAEKELAKQHKIGKPWDRYGTMSARHYSIYESMNGSAARAAGLAATGIWRAIRAENEGTPESHIGFVKKQLLANSAAGFLAISKVAYKLPPVAEKRHRFALWLLGGKQ